MPHDEGREEESGFFADFIIERTSELGLPRVPRFIARSADPILAEVMGDDLKQYWLARIDGKVLRLMKQMREQPW